MNTELVVQCLVASTNPATLEQATAKLTEICQMPESIVCFCEIAKGCGDAGLSYAALVYLYRVVKNLFSGLSAEFLCQVQNEILLLAQMPMESRHFRIIADIAALLYKSDESGWPQLLEFCQVKGAECGLVVSKILERIVEYFDGEKFAERLEWFTGVITSYLGMDNVEVRISGIVMFNVMMSHLDEFDGADPFILAINEVAGASVGMTEDEFTTIWTAIGDIIGGRKVNCAPLVQTALAICASPQLTSTQRLLAVTALVNGLDSYPDEMPTVLQFCTSVFAQLIEENERLPEEELNLLDDVFRAKPRVESYPIFIGRVMEDVNSGSKNHVAAGLLVLKTVLVAAPDCTHKDSGAIMDLILKGIDSGDELLILTAESVIESFKDTFGSLNVYGVGLLQKLIPFIACPSVPVRHHCYRAMFTLCDQLDCKVPGLFRAVWNLFSSVPREERSMYFILMACSIQLSPELDDQDISEILQLLQIVHADKSNPAAIASSFSIAHAVMEKDFDQIEDVMGIVAPSVGPCLMFDSVEVASDTVSFISDTIRSEICDASVFNEFLPKIAEFAFCDTDNLRCPALLTCCYMISSSEQHQELIPRIGEALCAGIERDGTEFQNTSIECVGIIAEQLTDPQRGEFFQRLHSIITESTNISVIEESIETFARLIDTAGAKEGMIPVAVGIIGAMINGETAFLSGVQLIAIDTEINLFRKICKLISTLIMNASQISQPICEFLLQWLNRDSELDKCPAIDALSDAIRCEAVSPEMLQAIVTAVVAVLPTANDPATQENIVYLLNVLIMKQPSFVGPVFGLMEGLTAWWMKALETKSGYQDVINNLASLFVVLAIWVPEFPEDRLCELLAEFPQTESETTGEMCQNLLLLLECRPTLGPEVMHQLALTIARIFMCDRNHMRIMNLDDNRLGALQGVLLTIVRANPGIVPELQGMCARSTARAKRLAAILQLA